MRERERGEGRRVANMEWCEEAPDDVFHVDVRDAYVLVNEHAKQVTFGVDMSFQTRGVSLAYPLTFYRLSVWEEETGEKDRIRKGNIWDDFAQSVMGTREGEEEGEGESVIRGHVTRSFAARPTNYEVTFGVHTTLTDNNDKDDNTNEARRSRVEDVVCFIVKFQVLSPSPSPSPSSSLSSSEL